MVKPTTMVYRNLLAMGSRSSRAAGDLLMDVPENAFKRACAATLDEREPGGRGTRAILDGFR